jgi:hypothetical protein
MNRCGKEAVLVANIRDLDDMGQQDVIELVCEWCEKSRACPLNEHPPRLEECPFTRNLIEGIPAYRCQDCGLDCLLFVSERFPTPTSCPYRQPKDGIMTKWQEAGA